MRRKLAILLTLVMMISMAALTACGKGAKESSTDKTTSTDGNTTENGSEVGEAGTQEETTIRFYNYELSETAKKDFWDKAVADFESKNPGIKIDTVTVDYNSMVNTFTNDIASGNSVDLIYGEVSWIPALAEAGFIQDPANVLSPDFYEGYYQNVLEAFKYNGTTYGVPHYFTNSIIFVNKDLVEGAGLSMDDFPTTLDGLKTWIETLGKYYANNQDIATIFGLATAEVPASGSNINAMIKAFGGSLINEDGTLADLTSGDNAVAVKECMDFYKYLIENKYTVSNQKLKDYRSAFGAGNVVMYVDSSWGYAQIQEAGENTADFTVTEPIPSTMGTYGKGETLVESHCFLIGSSLTDVQKSAVDKFIQYCTTTETMQDYLNNIGIAFVAHKNMESVQISPILEGALKGINNITTQTAIEPMISVQTKLATLVLNYTDNNMSFDDAIAQYITDANYYINQ